MLKKIFCALLMYPAITFAANLPNYPAVRSAILQGQDINVVMDFSKCTPAIDLAAFYSPKAIILTNGYLVFSDTHFTLNNPNFKNQPIKEFVRYKLDQNGNFEIETKFLNPVSYRKKGRTQPPAINCAIGEGVLFYSKS